jgi:epoxide hydrolase-like predicted phosphatase
VSRRAERSVATPVRAVISDFGGELTGALGRPISLDGFGTSFFADLAPNDALLDYLAELHGRGLRLGICTNNVREWSGHWQAMLPDPAIFHTIVDSSEVGSRKPDPRIYELVLAELDVAAGEAVFIDDLEVNCTAAAQLGMHAVWFRDSQQAIAETEAALAGSA